MASHAFGRGYNGQPDPCGHAQNEIYILFFMISIKQKLQSFIDIVGFHAWIFC